MNLKRYRVNNIKEALKFIKQDLGSDAMIVSTRQVKENTGAFGLFGKTMLEVTASASEKKKDSRSVPTTKALETYSGSAEASETVLADTFLTPRNKSVLSITDETRKMMLPIQKDLQGIRITLGDLSSQSNGLDKHLIGELKHELGEMRHMMHILASRTGGIAEPDLPENLLLLYQQMKFSGHRRKIFETPSYGSTAKHDYRGYRKFCVCKNFHCPNADENHQNYQGHGRTQTKTKNSCAAWTDRSW